MYCIAELCPAGFYCPPGGRGRIPCPQGTYQPNTSQTSEQACKSCPAGFYCPLGATSLIQCPIGTYQPNIKQTSELDCIVCPVGFYCPPGMASGIPCPQGTYQPNIGQTSEQACKSCPFFTNSSKNPSGIRPNAYEADCPGEDSSITSKGTAWIPKSKLERAFFPTCFCESVSRNGLQPSSSTIQIKENETVTTACAYVFSFGL